VEQELLTLPENTTSLSVFCGVRVTRSLVFCVVFYISLFALLSFFFWTLYCLSVYLRILITLLVPSNFSFYFYYPVIFYICSERCTQFWDIIMAMYILNRQNGMICYTEMPIHDFVIPVAFHYYAVIRADIEGYI
jgi:hypothetical protein